MLAYQVPTDGERESKVYKKAENMIGVSNANAEFYMAMENEPDHPRYWQAVEELRNGEES